MERTTEGRVVCLSPHPDDAVFSCGGMLSGWREMGRPVLVITVFAASSPPPEELSPLARLLHLAWGNLPDPMAHRRREDARALKVLGCTGRWWKYPDAIYRHPSYTSLEALYRQPPEEADLEKALLRRCRALKADFWLFPLAVGHHVDHQVLFRVGRAMVQAGRAVAFYEDLPYTAWEGGPEARLAEVGRPLSPEIIEVTPWWPRKTAAVSCYASQLPSLSRAGLSLQEALEGYGASLLPGGYAERLWWPEDVFMADFFRRPEAEVRGER
ncbi:MAG: PIG-L deacetylase family protein [Chloroflexia bacterium]